MRPMIANAATLLLSVVAALLLFEGGLRLVTDSDFGSPAPDCETKMYRRFGLLFDPVFAWRNAPGPWNERCGPREDLGTAAADDRVNAMGFRGPEIERKKPADTLRIVCLGDSGTLGVQKSDDPSDPTRDWRAISSYPALLARRLDQEGFDRVEVINAGVIGYTTSHGLRLLVLRILDLDPDVITIRFGANDAMTAWAPERRSLEPASGVARAALHAFHDWRLVRLALRGYQGLSSLHPKPYEVFWTTNAQFRRNLERIAAVSAEHGVRLLLLDYPLSPAASNPDAGELVKMQIVQRFPELRAILREFSSESGVPLLNTGAHLGRPRGRFFDDSDVFHPNAEGMRRIAELLFERLQTLGWLDAARPASSRPDRTRGSLPGRGAEGA